MTGLTIGLKVVLPYRQYGHDSALQGIFNASNFVVFLAEDLHVVGSGDNALHNAVRFETLAVTEELRSEKKDEKCDSLNGDFYAEDGKHGSKGLAVDRALKLGQGL